MGMSDLELEYMHIYEELDISPQVIADLKAKFGRAWSDIIADLVLDYLSWEEEGVPSYNKAQGRLPFTIMSINFKVDKLYEEIKREMLVYLSVIYMRGAVSLNLSPKHRTIVEQIVSQIWTPDNLTFLVRLDRHKTKLKASLYSTLENNLIARKPVKKGIQELQKVFTVALENSKRVAETETNHVINTVFLDYYRESGIEEYTYSAILDKRTSTICEALDGESFLVVEATTGENFPPMHPRCRSFTYPKK